jgi:ATP-dependent exoDNAse (exonuclease V) beta subunit
MPPLFASTHSELRALGREDVVSYGWRLSYRRRRKPVKATLQASRAARLEEEMRVFYVAVTRAQHAVTFVGTKGGSTNAPGDDYYSWKDELRRAWANVRALGGGSNHLRRGRDHIEREWSR